MEYIIALIVSTLIICLRIKTNAFERIKKFIDNILKDKKAMMIITRFILIVTPIICFIFLLIISSLLIIEIAPNTTMPVSKIEGNRFWLDIIEFLKYCILYSPLFWLTIIFLFQIFEDKYEQKNIEENDNKLEILLVNMQIPLLTSYITIIIFTVFEYIMIKLEMNIFEMKVFEYFEKYFSGNVELYSEDMIRIILIISLGLIYCIFVCFMSLKSMASAFEYYNRLQVEKINKNKILAYKIFLFIPIINILLVYFIKKRLRIMLG